MSKSVALKKYLDDAPGDFYFEAMTGIIEDAKIDIHSINEPKEFVKQLQDNAFVNKESLETEAELFIEETNSKPKKAASLLEIGTTIRQQLITHPRFVSHAIGFFESEKEHSY